MKHLKVLLFLYFAAFACPSPAGSLPSEAARILVQNAVADVLSALARSDFSRLASFIGPEGLALSPYVMLDQEDVRLSRAEVEGCAGSPRIRLWGHRDGSGDPIEITCAQYFKEFVWNADYTRADEVLYNVPRQRGNEPNNNHSFAPDGIVVELHIRESPEGVEPYRPWTSLRLIFRRGERGLYLIAITRDLWTI